MKLSFIVNIFYYFIKLLNAGALISKKLFVICFNGSPLKMMKNVFYISYSISYFLYFILFSFLRYLNICPDFLVTEKNGLRRKLRLISKFMTSQTGQQVITIHILFNIVRSKGKQATIFGHLIEYNKKYVSWKTIHKIWWRKYSQTVS